MISIYLPPAGGLGSRWRLCRLADAAYPLRVKLCEAFDKPSNRMLFPTVRKDNIYYEKVTGQKHRPAGDA
jgi:hypothetical protein